MKQEIYNAEISAGSMMLPESRRIARLMLDSPSHEHWLHALKVENILQKSPTTALRQAQLIRNRLKTIAEEGWQLIVDGNSELASQILFIAALRHSRLLADFLRDVYHQDLRRMAKSITPRQWEDFLSDCENRDNQVADWAVSTRKKLFQVIVRILVEAKYLDSSRTMNLTPPMLHPQTIAFLLKYGYSDLRSKMDIS